MTPSRWRSSSWTPQKQPPARMAVSVLSLIALSFLSRLSVPPSLGLRSRCSVLGKRRERLLRRPVPPESRDGTLPSSAHVVERAAVGVVAAGDHLLEMGVLRLDDLVGLVAVVLCVARATELPACHGLHAARLDLGGARSFSIPDRSPRRDTGNSHVPARPSPPWNTTLVIQITATACTRTSSRSPRVVTRCASSAPAAPAPSSRRSAP